MDTLQNDLRQSHQHVIKWLYEYQKVTEDVIMHNHSQKIYQMLEAISCFDVEKIKSNQFGFTDQIVAQHLETIAERIQIKGNQVENQKIKKDVENVQREPRIVEKVQSKYGGKKEGKSQGFLGSFVKKFKSKEKKINEIILPDQEPDCEWDPVRRVYVFAGQEPDLPKEISKPPPKGQKPKQEQKKPTQVSQLDNLTAPPSFKRKGTGATNKSKSKSKKEQIQELPQTQEPMTFAKILQSINKEYDNLATRLREGVYQSNTSQVHISSEQGLPELMEVFEKLLVSSEEVAEQEIRIIDKLNQSIGESHEIKLMQKVMGQINESSSIYQLISSKLVEIQKNKGYNVSQGVNKIQKVDYSQQEYYRTEYERVSSDLRKVILQRDALQVKLSDQTVNERQGWERAKENQELYERNVYLEKEVVELKRQWQALYQREEERMRQMEVKYLQEEKQLNRSLQTLRGDNAELMSLVDQLRSQNLKIRSEKLQLERSYQTNQAHLSNSTGKQNEEVMKEKIRIQTQLKFYQEKQKNYLANIRGMEEHNSFIFELERTLQQENNLLSNILEKRIQVGRITEHDEVFMIQKMQFEDTPHSVVLELSSIINSITETHLDRLEMFNKNYCHLNKKYRDAKQLLKKIKDSASNQNLSLNRSVSRLKSLIQTYRAAKEQSQQRCKLSELQCERLKKKMQHYKQEDKFNRSYLSKIKTSTANNQNDSVISLQEDNEELVQTIEDLQNEVGVKGENNVKLQSDLEDILGLYEKNQAKLMQIQKKARELDNANCLMKDQREEFMNKIHLIQVKLANQKEKNGELVKSQNAKLKKVEDTLEKKIKILREELERYQQIEQDLNKELLQQRGESSAKIRELNKQISQRQVQLQEKVRVSQSQNVELLQLVEEMSKKLEEKEQTLTALISSNSELKQRQEQLINSIHDYNTDELSTLRESEKTHNEMIHSILKQYRELEQEEMTFREEYEEKIGYLSLQLLEANKQSERFIGQLQQYGSLVNQLQVRMKEVDLKNEEEKISTRQKINKLQSENEQLGELVTCLQEELDGKKDEEEMNSQKAVIAELQKLNREVQEKVTQCEIQLQVKRQENQEREHQTMKLQEQNQGLQRDINQMKGLIEEMEKEREEFDKGKQVVVEGKAEEVEGEMEYLLKQIDEKENQISLLKDKLQAVELKLLETVKESQQKQKARVELMQEKRGLVMKLEEVEERCKREVEESKDLSELVETLQKQLQTMRQENIKEEQQDSQSTSMIKNELKEKHQELTSLELQKQQIQRILFVSQNQLKQQQNIIKDLQNKIQELSQIIQAQEDTIKQPVAINKIQEDDQLRSNLAAKELQLVQTKKDLEELSNTLVTKSVDYENKIQSLQREILTVSSLKAANQKLEDSIKELQNQNATLIDEKVELMRSNDNLVKINEKLIFQISPHNSKPKPKQQPSKSEKSSIQVPDKNEVKATQQKKDDNKQGKKEEKKQIKKGQQKEVLKVEGKQGQAVQQSGGIMSTISGWFLTPTENDNLLNRKT